ncbi:IS30 family transposase [Patescibacteria group bacterium]|nr:IS30 family transposase [Patescibacteria group bacterium]
MLEKGISHQDIARKLNRNQSTISRETARNTKYGKNYIPCHAHARYERITRKQRYKAPLKSPEIFLYVREHLRHPYYWSPEVISGRLKRESKSKLTITPECIYQYIYSKKAKRYKLWQYLPSGRKKRMIKKGRKVRNNGKAPNLPCL